MRSRFAALLLAALVAPRSPARLAAQAPCPPGPTALVLAGGGAKGFVHLGVIHTLDSLGIRPDFIVGTSIGAIVGALYASGYSSRELDSLTRGLPLADLVRPRTQAPDRAYTLFRPLVYWELNDGHFRLAPAAVPEQGVDAALNRLLLRGNLEAQGDFRRLPIPFFAVATDLATQRPVALHEGDLAQAVRASMAIPLVFEPVRIGGRTLGDGGLSANVPVRVARELGARRLIISDLVRRQTTVIDFGNPLTVGTALIDYLFSQAADSALPGDVAIETDVTGAGNLDFSPTALDSLVVRGARAARAAFADGGRCLPIPAGPRPAAAPLPARVTKLRVPGFRRRELEDLLGTLGLADGIALDPEVLRRGFDDFARDGRFRSVWLNPTPTDSGVAFDLQVKRAPEGGAGVGIAYDNELGARMWAGGLLRDPVTRTFELTGLVTIGGLRRDIQGAARRRFYTFGRPIFVASAFAGQEEVPFFTPEGVPDFRPRVERAVGTMGVEWDPGVEWLFRLAGEANAWSDTASAGHEALGAAAYVQRATEDGEILTAIEVQGSRQFRRAHATIDLPIRVGRVTFTPGVRGGVVKGDEIPPTATFALGGYEGFPGLHLLERRGQSEAMASLGASYQLNGPLLLRLEVMSGNVAGDSTDATRRLLHTPDWLVGWRLGVGVRSSPLGPVRLEYGATNIGKDYRDQVMLRVGRWF